MKEATKPKIGFRQGLSYAFKPNIVWFLPKISFQLGFIKFVYHILLWNQESNPEEYGGYQQNPNYIQIQWNEKFVHTVKPLIYVTP